MNTLPLLWLGCLPSRSGMAGRFVQSLLMLVTANCRIPFGTGLTAQELLSLVISDFGKGHSAKLVRDTW